MKIFISYAKEDIEHAKKLYDRLMVDGYDPWLDEEKLLPGQKWEVYVEDAIKDCDFFIALLSSNSVTKTGYVQKELRKALDMLEKKLERDIFIIPVRLNECLPSHPALEKLQRVDLFDSKSSEWDRAYEKIISVIKRKKDSNDETAPRDNESCRVALELGISYTDVCGPDAVPAPIEKANFRELWDMLPLPAELLTETQCATSPTEFYEFSNIIKNRLKRQYNARVGSCFSLGFLLVGHCRVINRIVNGTLHGNGNDNLTVAQLAETIEDLLKKVKLDELAKDWNTLTRDIGNGRIAKEAAWDELLKFVNIVRRAFPKSMTA